MAAQLLVLAFLCALRLAAAAAAGTGASAVSFSLVHRDAPRSVIKNGALEEGIPAGLPLRDLLVAGRAMRERTSRRRRARARSRGEELRFSYLGESVGDFYLTASVGTPPQKLVFIVDSGSELTWTQCRPCQVCGSGGAPSFAFSKSSSYKRIPCRSPLCSQSLGFAHTCSNSTARSCVFVLHYGGGSEDEGYISVDTFRFGKRARAAPLVFGCAVINLDTQTTANSGIAGINNGPYSFSSQILTAHARKKFAYCLPDRITSLNATGALIFGDYAPPARLQYTPLVPPYSPMGDLYYYIGVERISVGGRVLKLGVSSLRSDAVGSGGMLLDSGTAITHFVEPVYKAVVKAMVEQTAHMRPYVAKELGVCYNISTEAQDLPRVPDVTLHLAGGVDMVWNYRSLLYAAGVSGDVLVVCLALAVESSSSENIIGNYQQQNYWVEYDVESSRVGLARANCATWK